MEEKQKSEDEVTLTEYGIEDLEVKVDTSLIERPTEGGEKKTLVGLQTWTFLDSLYLNETNQPLNGVPIVGQIGIVGLSGVGKSLLVQEIALRAANEGKGVIFVTSEDSWRSETKRYDLQSRMIEKAKVLGLDWNKIKGNLYILDTLVHSELREWTTLAETYRYLVEEEKNIELLIIDSLSLLESYRGLLKVRVLDLSRYNQKHGITAFYVCQRSEEETDRFSISGGIGVAHNLDSVICIDFAKAMGQLKDDLQKKQWEITHFTRILSCRLSGFDRKYTEMEITNNGFLRAKSNRNL